MVEIEKNPMANQKLGVGGADKQRIRDQIVFRLLNSNLEARRQ